jgi:hypothetical protein
MWYYGTLSEARRSVDCPTLTSSVPTSTGRSLGPPSRPARAPGTGALISNKQKIEDKSSRMDLLKNDDGSVDIYIRAQCISGVKRTFLIGMRDVR